MCCRALEHGTAPCALGRWFWNKEQWGGWGVRGGTADSLEPIWTQSDTQGNPAGLEGRGMGHGGGKKEPRGHSGGKYLDFEQERALSTPTRAPEPYHRLCLQVSVYLSVSASLCVSVSVCDSLSLCADVSQQRLTGLSPGPLPQSTDRGVRQVSASPLGTLHLPLSSLSLSLLTWEVGTDFSVGVHSTGLASLSGAWPLCLLFIETVRPGKHWCPAQRASKLRSTGEAGHIPRQHLVPGRAGI